MNPILGRVREALDEAGKGQLERVGSQQLISKWRTQDVELTAASLAKVAKVLGLNGHWLLTGQGDRHELSGGADEVFAAGVQAGLGRAEGLLRALRATSDAVDGAAVAAEAERLLRGALADLAAHNRRQPPDQRRKPEG